MSRTLSGRINQKLAQLDPAGLVPATKSFPSTPRVYESDVLDSALRTYLDGLNIDGRLRAAIEGMARAAFVRYAGEKDDRPITLGIGYGDNLVMVSLHEGHNRILVGSDEPS